MIGICYRTRNPIVSKLSVLVRLCSYTINRAENESDMKCWIQKINQSAIKYLNIVETPYMDWMNSFIGFHNYWCLMQTPNL